MDLQGLHHHPPDHQIPCCIDQDNHAEQESLSCVPVNVASIDSVNAAGTHVGSSFVLAIIHYTQTASLGSIGPCPVFFT